jgi:uncharacterized protein
MSDSTWVKKSTNAIAAAAVIGFPLMGSVCLAQATPRVITTQAEEPSFAAFKPYWVDRPVMEVIGRATRELPPNIATTSFKFEATDKDANVALTTVTRAARSAIDRVQRLAGNKVEISASSTRQDFYEQYRDRAGNRIENARPDKLERSTITWIVTLKLTDTSLVPRARAEMLNGVGSSEYGGVSFTLVPTEAQMREVMGLALDDGRERARQMSALHSGRTRLLVVQEGTSQCLSQASTPEGFAAYAPSPPPPPPPPAPPPPPSADGSYVRQSSELVLPSAPSPTAISASVCMIYALD